MTLLTNSDMGTEDVSGVTITRIMFWRWVGWLLLVISVGIGRAISSCVSGEAFHVNHPLGSL
jgi:hypothetical protein